ncbi:DUF3298 domain-containing protein [Paenibacillus cisolokensis]|jgi:hypothetical protein|uniref:DUF3298 domain-containing protein n=1 Tax=Paenibacillus cisolokensis TaxID=1658519 RepID=A0ABQ4N467_9BACL|nr:DUF3298 and DUF4163 domain-containing protein [Paenibacillus cisolokensis]GIQ62985.1 hypothetical protein PACILC2_15530 [Paenibacillus cisolokensis]
MVFHPPPIISSHRVVLPKTELWVPVVRGLHSRRAEADINDAIRGTVRQLVVDQGSLDDPRAEMIGYFETKTNHSQVLSISLFNYAYTGGAHGLTLQRSLTFDTTTGRSYALHELFKPGSPYVKVLSEIVAEQIKERKIDTLQPFQSIRPDQDFYVADRSLVIYFQLYELAPYVYGFPYFPISVYELEPIINDDGPLAAML